jgi:uncharacterized protein (DUF1684 family)
MPALPIYGDRQDKMRLHAHIPLTMHDQLTKRAVRNHRSLTREVIAIIDQFLQKEQEHEQEIVVH